jgi:predicted phage-related endonuclease
LIYQYAAADAKVKEFTEKKQLAENLLKNMLGENEIGDVGFHAVSWKSQSRTQLDSSAIKANHPRIFKKYARTSTHRRFTIKAAT